jgi:hypothetical protein
MIWSFANGCSLITMAVILSSCVSTEGGSSLPNTLAISQTTTLSASQMKAVQSAVRANVENAKSARFGRIVAGISNTGTTHVCGLVNTKDEDGSYTGMIVYSGEFDGDTFQFEGLGDSLELICAQQGLTPER